MVQWRGVRHCWPMIEDAMNEFIERVAWAIERAEEDLSGAVIVGRQFATKPHPDSIVKARKAIEAMRNATEAMQDAAINAVTKERDACRAAGTRGWSYSEVDITWGAMINEALQEPSANK